MKTWEWKGKVRAFEPAADMEALLVLAKSFHSAYAEAVSQREERELILKFGAGIRSTREALPAAPGFRLKHVEVNDEVEPEDAYRFLLEAAFATDPRDAADALVKAEAVLKKAYEARSGFAFALLGGDDEDNPATGDYY